MSESDYLDLGDWNAQCFRCGRKRKAGQLRRQWQGFHVCPEHWETRHPQDYVRGIPDLPAPPWVQPEALVYVGPNICTSQARSAVPGYAGPGCMIPSNPYVFP